MGLKDSAMVPLVYSQFIMPEDDAVSLTSKSMLSIIEMLEQDPDLDVMDQLFLENHMYVLNAAYHGWKQRNDISTAGHSGEV